MSKDARSSDPKRVTLGRILESGNLSRYRKGILFQNLLTCIQKLHSLGTAHGEIDLESILVEDSIYVTLGPFSSNPSLSRPISIFTAPEHQQSTNSQQERQNTGVGAHSDGRRGQKHTNTTAADLWAVGVVGLCVFGVDGVLQAVRVGTGLVDVCDALVAAVAGGEGGREDREEGGGSGRGRPAWRAGRDAKQKRDEEDGRQQRADSEPQSCHAGVGALRASICEALDIFPRLRCLLAIDPTKRDFTYKSTEAAQEPSILSRDSRITGQVLLNLELSIQEIRRPIDGGRYSPIDSITDDTLTCSLIMPDKSKHQANIAHTEMVEIPLAKIKTHCLGSWVASELTLLGIRDPTFSLDLKLASSRRKESNTSGKAVFSELGILGPILASLSQNGAQIRENRWIVMEDVDNPIQNVIQVGYAVRATSAAPRQESSSSKRVPSTITLATRNKANSSISPTNLAIRTTHIRADSLERQKEPIRCDMQLLSDLPEQPKPPKPPNSTLHSPKPPVKPAERSPTLTNQSDSAFNPHSITTEHLSPLSATRSPSNPPEEPSNTRADSRTRRERLSRKYSLSTSLAAPQSPQLTTNTPVNTESDRRHTPSDPFAPPNTQTEALEQQHRVERSAVRAFLRKGSGVVGHPVQCGDPTPERDRSGAKQSRQHTGQNGQQSEDAVHPEGVEGRKSEAAVTQLRKELESSMKRYQDQYGLLCPKKDLAQSQESGLSGTEVASYDNLLRKLKDLLKAHTN